MLKKKEPVKTRKPRKKQDESIILTGKAKEKEEEKLREKEYKFPLRSCKQCLNYPCFYGIENLKADFAKYGCVDFELDKDSKDIIDYSEEEKNGREEKLERI